MSPMGCASVDGAFKCESAETNFGRAAFASSTDVNDIDRNGDFPGLCFTHAATLNWTPLTVATPEYSGERSDFFSFRNNVPELSFVSYAMWNRLVCFEDSLNLIVGDLVN